MKNLLKVVSICTLLSLPTQARAMDQNTCLANYNQIELWLNMQLTNCDNRYQTIINPEGHQYCTLNAKRQAQNMALRLGPDCVILLTNMGIF